VLPCGFTDGGLPVSLQVIGRGYEEALIVRIGWAFENATGWHKRRPPAQ
jgi:Asp-tRNA(Asn)/Glu-tRNA(Gln) amidotransferase A subunit family amidase